MGITEAELMDEGAARAVTTKPAGVQPSIGIQLPASGALEIEAAIETVAQALAKLTEAERAAVMGKFGQMVDAYDSGVLKQGIAKLLTPTVGEAHEAFTQASKKAA